MDRYKFRWHDSFQKALDVHFSVVLVGKPGVGKTTESEAEAIKRTGHPCEVLQCTPATELSHLIGTFTLHEDGTVFKDGPLVRSYKHVRFLLVEEINLANTEIRSELLSVRNASMTNPFTGERLVRPPEFRMICTSNDESVSKCRQNAEIARALLDDCIVIEIDPVGPDQVAGMLLSEYPNVDENLHATVMREWNDVYCLAASDDHKSNVTLGYRQAQHLMKLLLGKMPLRDARTLALINHFISDEEFFNSLKIRESIQG